MKQTAVEWLVEQLCIEHRKTLVNQAKEMEKQQIIDAFHKHSQKIYCEEEAEQYYNEKFNK